PHVITQEASLDRIIRRDQVRHRGGGEPLIRHGGRSGRRVLDLRQRDVVATHELTVAVGTVVVGHPEHLAIWGDGTPRLPLRGWSEARCRCDIDRGTPGDAAICRVSIEHVVVARWSGGCRRTVGITVCAAVAKVRPDKVEFATSINRYRALYKVIEA